MNRRLVECVAARSDQESMCVAMEQPRAVGYSSEGVSVKGDVVVVVEMEMQDVDPVQLRIRFSF